MKKLRERNHAAFCICRSVHLSAPSLRSRLCRLQSAALSSPSTSAPPGIWPRSPKIATNTGWSGWKTNGVFLCYIAELSWFIHTECHHDFMSLWLLESILNSLSELQHPVQFGGQFLPFLRRKLADNVLPSLLGDVSGAAPAAALKKWWISNEEMSGIFDRRL